MHGLQVALRLRDTAGIQWACVGVLSQTWPSDKAVWPNWRAGLPRPRSSNSAQRIKLQKPSDSRRRSTTQWSAIASSGSAGTATPKWMWPCRSPRARSARCAIRGPPPAARCSPAPPRGRPTTKALPSNTSFPKVLPAPTRCCCRRVWGKPTAGKVTVDIYSHWGTKKATHQRRQIPVGEQDALVTFELKDGRRQEPLAQAQAANAAQAMIGVNQAILAQMVAAPAANAAAVANPAAVNPAAAANANANNIAQLLAQINDPNVAQAFALSARSEHCEQRRGWRRSDRRQRAEPVRIAGGCRLPAGHHHAAGRNQSGGHGRDLGRPPLCADQRRAAVLVDRQHHDLQLRHRAQSVQSGSGGQLGQGACKPRVACSRRL